VLNSDPNFMRQSQIAAQLYTIRDHCQTSAALAASARKLREIGFRAVQVSAIGPIPDDEVVSIMAGEGLVICATHEPAPQILAEPQLAIDRVKRLGCKLTAYPYPRDINMASMSEVKKLAARLDEVGALFSRQGLQLGYHNHALEFARCEGGTALDYIYNHTRPENLVAELDTYWVQFGGGDAAAWCRKLRGRLPFIHLKDYVFVPETNQPVYGEIGAGNLDFPGIIAAAESSGCEWFIVEQDICPGDPFDSLRRSLEYLRTLVK